MSDAMGGQQFRDITNEWVEVGPPKKPHPDAGTKLAGATQLVRTGEHLPAGQGIRAYVVGMKGPHELHEHGPATLPVVDAHLAGLRADPAVAADFDATRGSWHQKQGVSQSVPEEGYKGFTERVIYDRGRRFEYRDDVHPDHPQSRDSVRERALKFGRAQKQDAIFGLEDYEEPNVHEWAALTGRVQNALIGHPQSVHELTDFVFNNRQKN